MDDKKKPLLPDSDVKAILTKKIRDLYKLGWNYSEIAELLWVSKSTISYAIKGRAKKKVEKTIIN